MKVLQVCPYSWNAVGGVQVHVRQLARHLAARGHEVAVLAPGHTPLQDAHVHIVGRPMRIRCNGSAAPVCLSLRSAAMIRRAMQRIAPDIVHVHEPLSPGTSMAAVFFSNAPVVATFHASHERSVLSGLYGLAGSLLSALSPRLTAGIAVSETAAACACSSAGEPARVVPNGVDARQFSPGPPRRTAGRQLLFVNRLEPRKGFSTAVRAFAHIADAFPDLQLVVVGDGVERRAIVDVPARLRPRVLMVGERRNEDVPPFYASADVFLATATGRESFGIVLLEAMASGVPVVASDIAGYREVVQNGSEGILVAPSNPAAVAEAVSRILANPELARRFGEAGRAKAVRYSWETIAEQVEEVYGEAVGAPRPVECVPPEIGLVS